MSSPCCSRHTLQTALYLVNPILSANHQQQRSDRQRTSTTNDERVRRARWKHCRSLIRPLWNPFVLCVLLVQATQQPVPYTQHIRVVTDEHWRLIRSVWEFHKHCVDRSDGLGCRCQLVHVSRRLATSLNLSFKLAG